MTIARQLLVAEIQSLAASHSPVLVGIDGYGGAGKSTLARELADAIAGASIIPMDDFFLPPASFDWRRLLTQVIEPFRAGATARYRRYDWISQRIEEWQTVGPSGVILIEGVTAMRRELRLHYNVTIWVDCPRDARLSRGLARDGEQARDRWEKIWMPAEDQYFCEHRPDEAARFVVSGLEVS